MKKKVLELLTTAFEERPDLYLLEMTISTGNDIKLIVDGDHAISVEDCMFISRAVEHNLDREEVDFSLEVATAGVGTPLQHTRQYMKNVGRTMEVKDVEGNQYKAKVVEATEKAISLTWKSREPKKIGKGKETVVHEIVVPYEKIDNAKVIITF